MNILEQITNGINNGKIEFIMLMDNASSNDNLFEYSENHVYNDDWIDENRNITSELALADNLE